MKKIISSLILILISVSVFSQSKNNTKYLIKNVGSISIPASMELQSGKYKELSETYQKELSKYFDFEISSNRVVFQQNGLNKFNNEGFKRYARVIIETTFGNKNDFEKLDFDINQFSQTDVQELNETFKKQIGQNFYGTPLKLITWYNLKVEKINGMSCIHIKYKRQLKSSPYVMVNMYIFHNNDRMHTLTMSYRLSEKNYWETYYYNILKSFKITKK